MSLRRVFEPQPRPLPDQFFQVATGRRYRSSLSLQAALCGRRHGNRSQPVLFAGLARNGIGIARSTNGGHAKRLFVSSTKSSHGHALGAASALEAVATALAVKHQLLPPTCNFTEPDPACDVRLVVNQAQPAEVEYAISNSFAFGGLNAAIVFRRHE